MDASGRLQTAQSVNWRALCVPRKSDQSHGHPSFLMLFIYSSAEEYLSESHSISDKVNPASQTSTERTTTSSVEIFRITIRPEEANGTWWDPLTSTAIAVPSRKVISLQVVHPIMQTLTIMQTLNAMIVTIQQRFTLNLLFNLGTRGDRPQENFIFDRIFETTCKISILSQGSVPKSQLRDIHIFTRVPLSPVRTGHS